MKKKKVFILIAVLFAVILTGIVIAFCLRKESLTDEERIEILRDSSVMIHVTDASASGVIIKKDESALYIATCAHLMQGFDQGIVTLVTGNTIFGDVTFIDEAKDVAILKVDSEYVDPFLYEELKAARLNPKALRKIKKGDPVYIAGSALSVGSNIVMGTFVENDYYVPEFERGMIYIYADTMSGMSGSGVFNEDAELIGVLAGGSDNSEAVCIAINDFLETEEIKNDKN